MCGLSRVARTSILLMRRVNVCVWGEGGGEAGRVHMDGTSLAGGPKNLIICVFTKSKGACLLGTMQATACTLL